MGVLMDVVNALMANQQKGLPGDQNGTAMIPSDSQFNGPLDKLGMASDFAGLGPSNQSQNGIAALMQHIIGMPKQGFQPNGMSEQGAPDQEAAPDQEQSNDGGGLDKMAKSNKDAVDYYQYNFPEGGSLNAYGDMDLKDSSLNSGLRKMSRQRIMK